MGTTVYKICARREWTEAQGLGRYVGSADDRRDGYIHLSTAAQLPGTIARHFEGRDDLVLIALDSARLGAALKWEPSRGGESFPHLYAPLRPDAAAWVRPLARGPDGSHELPPEAKA